MLVAGVDWPLAGLALNMYKSNVGQKTKMFNSGGYILKDASGGSNRGEFFRAGEDDGSVCLLLYKIQSQITNNIFKLYFKYSSSPNDLSLVISTSVDIDLSVGLPL